jgi:hypothetical protein
MSGAIFAAGGRREWAAYRAILMHPVHERRAQGSLWLSWLLIALVLLASVGATRVGAKGWLLLAFGAGAPLGMLLFMWWIFLFGAILRQSSASAVHLLPRMRERTMRVTVAAWASVTLLMTLCVGIPTGYPGQVAVVTGLVLLEVTVMFSPWRIGVFAAALWIRSLVGFATPDWLIAFLASNGALALGALLLVLDGRVALRRMFGTANGLRAWSMPTSAFPLLFDDVLRFMKATMPGERSLGQPLITRVLGPAPFAGTWSCLVLLAGASLAIRSLIALQGTGPAHERLLMTRWMVLVGLLMLQGFLAHGAAGRMYRRQGEQALVRLSPAAPLASNINRLLARELLMGFAALWGACAFVALAVQLVLGASQGEVMRAAAVCSFSLVLAGLPLRDYARGKESHAISTLVLTLYLAAVVAAGFALLNGQLAANIWAALALTSMVLAALFVWRRWRGMVNAAPAFPAGRNR